MVVNLVPSPLIGNHIATITEPSWKPLLLKHQSSISATLEVTVKNWRVGGTGFTVTRRKEGGTSVLLYCGILRILKKSYKRQLQFLQDQWLFERS